MFVMKSPPPPRSSAISFALLALLFVTFSASYAVTFNGREYTQYSSQWFEVYQGDTFRVVGTEIFVYFESTATQNQIDALNTSLEGEIVETFDDGCVVIQSTDSPAPDPLDFMDAYLDSPLVDEGSNNTYGFYCWPDDPAVNDAESPFLQRHLVTLAGDNFDNSINPGPAWDIGVGTREVKVGILDSGILYRHSDLGGNIWQNTGNGELDEDVDGDGTLLEVDGQWYLDLDDLNEIDDDGNDKVDDLIGWNATTGGPNPKGGPHEVGDMGDGVFECKHGTKVAGIIGAMSNNGYQFAGIAGGDWSNPEDPQNPVKIVCCKMGTIVGGFGQFDNRDVSRGLGYLIDDAEVDIINMSFRTTSFLGINNRLVQASNAGILLIASAGKFEGDMFYPANHELVMAIGLSEDDEGDAFSATGPKLAIMAPGSQTAQEDPPDPYVVYTTGVYTGLLNAEIEADPEEEADVVHCFENSTSAAAAQVSATAALLLSHAQSPDELVLTVENIIEILCVSASRSGEAPYALGAAHPYGAWDEHENEEDEEMGYGELNCGNAVVYGKRQDIALVSGWRMISSRIEPFHTADNLLNDENGILLSWKEVPDGNITTLKNSANQTWDGSQNPANCNIPSWNPLAGYKVNMSAGSTLVMLGKSLHIDTEIALNAGWNWVGYLPEDILEAQEAFFSLVNGEEAGNLNMVKNGVGQFYIPDYYNNIPDCKPGEGFEVSLDNNTTLDYSVQQAAPKRPNDDLPPVVASEPEYFILAARTDYFHPLLITGLSVEGVDCASGDELAVFTRDGVCIGAAVYDGQIPMGLAIWRDDPTTEAVDGYCNGDLFLLKYWSVSEHALFGPDTLDIFGGLDAAPSQIYTSANISFGKSVAIVPTSFAVSAPYPNPFNMNTSLRFELPDAGTITITISDASGRLVKEQKIEQPRAGYFTWTWNGNDMRENPVTSGTYFCRIDFATPSGERKSMTSKFTALR